MAPAFFGCAGYLLLHVGALVAVIEGYSLLHRLVIVVASLVAEHRP